MEVWEDLGLKELGKPTEVQLRGRWQSIRSLKNHEKGGRLAQLFGLLDKTVQQQCIKAADSLPSKLRNLR